MGLLVYSNHDAQLSVPDAFPCPAPTIHVNTTMSQCTYTYIVIVIFIVSDVGFLLYSVEDLELVCR